MSYEITKKEGIKDTQISVFDLAEIVKYIDTKYPHSKINPSIIEGDKINGFTVKGKPIEEYASGQNELWTPTEDIMENKKQDLYHQNN